MTELEQNFTNNMTAMEPEEDLNQLLMDLMTNLDDLFRLLMGAIILFMQAGFALMELGTVRAKNGTSILMKNISDMCFGEQCFLLFLSLAWSS